MNLVDRWLTIENIKDRDLEYICTIYSLYIIIYQIAHIYNTTFRWIAVCFFDWQLTAKTFLQNIQLGQTYNKQTIIKRRKRYINIGQEINAYLWFLENEIGPIRFATDHLLVFSVWYISKGTEITINICILSEDINCLYFTSTLLPI